MVCEALASVYDSGVHQRNTQKHTDEEMAGVLLREQAEQKKTITEDISVRHPTATSLHHQSRSRSPPPPPPPDIGYWRSTRNKHGFPNTLSHIQHHIDHRPTQHTRVTSIPANLDSVSPTSNSGHHYQQQNVLSSSLYDPNAPTVSISSADSSRPLVIAFSWI